MGARKRKEAFAGVKVTELVVICVWGAVASALLALGAYTTWRVSGAPDPELAGIIPGAGCLLMGTLYVGTTRAHIRLSGVRRHIARDPLWLIEGSAIRQRLGAEADLVTVCEKASDVCRTYSIETPGMDRFLLAIINLAADYEPGASHYRREARRLGTVADEALAHGPRRLFGVSTRTSSRVASTVKARG